MKNTFRCVLLGYLQSALRLGFVVSVYFALTGKETLVWALAAAGLLLLVLMPGRFMLGRQWGDRADGAPSEKGNYFKRFFQGLIRFFHGFVFSVPVIALVVFLLNALLNLPFNEAGQIIQQFSAVVFREPSVDTGLMGVGVVLAVLGALAVWGWRRQMPMEYLRNTGKMTARQLIGRTMKMRRRGLGKFTLLTSTNLLIALPGMAIFALVLVPYVWNQLSIASGNMMLMLQFGLQIIKRPLPVDQLLLLLAGYLVVYTPLYILRKMRIAKAVRSLEK